MSLWRPFPPGAQALVPPGFLTVRCPHCDRGTVVAADSVDPVTLLDMLFAQHRAQHDPAWGTPECIGPVGLPDRTLVLNVAASLDAAARRATNPVARIRGIRQARSLRYPWAAWLWELLPE